MKMLGAGSLMMRKGSSTLLPSSRPSVRRPWQAILLLVVIWFIWNLGENVYDFTHPSIARDVKWLHRHAQKEFDSLLGRQSKSLSAARATYQKRYGIAPPPGYDAWYKYAVDHESPIIDDFDDLMSDLRPYRAFIQEGCDMTANNIVSDDLVRICVGDHKVGVEGSQSAVQSLLDAVNRFAPSLPNLCITVNLLEQPRTVIGHAMLSSIFGPNPPATCEVQHFRDMSKQNVWLDTIQSCPADSPARNPPRPERSRPYPPLMKNWNDATDLCTSSKTPPSGMILAPEQMRLSNVVRPILSSAKLSTYADVRFPTASHFRGATEPDLDSYEWENKRSVLFWRGDSSGGWISPLNWRDFQRQKMVALASTRVSPAEPKTSPTNRNAAASREYSRQLRSFKQWLDIGFTQLTSCDPVACEVMKRELGLKNATSAERPFEYKFVLTMDGHGADLDLYKLMRSNSAVMRQGLVREWHESRLIPCELDRSSPKRLLIQIHQGIHYIPLSMSGDELPQMLEYLLDDGDSIAQRIAEESREWAEKALRKEDMNIYLYRLLIELGRRTF